MRLGLVLRRIAKFVMWTFAGILLIGAITLGVFRWLAEQREVIDSAVAAPKSGRFVQSNDVQLFIQESGPSDGRVVVLIHGTGAWSETWRHTQHALTDKGFRVIALDLPPFGYSERSRRMSYTKEAQGRRIVGLLESLGIQKAVLVGHSFGAGPTVEAALAMPERVSRLVIVDGALGIRDDGVDAKDSLGQRALATVLRIRPLREGVVATFVSNPAFTRTLIESFVADPSSVTDEYVHIYQRPIPVNGGTTAVGAWLPELLAPEVHSRSEDPKAYRSLTLSTTIIWGKLDSITPIEQGTRLRDLIAGSQLVELENVGHIPQIEATQEFNRVLLQALAN